MQVRARCLHALSCLLLVACGGARASVPPTRRAPPPTPPSPAPVVAPVASPVPTPVRASSCRPPAPGSTSSDEAPSIGGGTGSADPLVWLEERGVTRDASLAWLAAHYGSRMKEDALSFVSGPPCQTVRVGGDEDALACFHMVPTLLTENHALAFVVRNRAPVAVLDVGIGSTALDFPDVQWLDLSLVFASDGMSATLADRAPDGTTLVESVTRCREREAHDVTCEQKLAAHPNPESLAQRSGSVELIALLDDCIVTRGNDGKLAVSREREEDSRSPFADGPTILHDCAGARRNVVAMQRELASSPPEQRADGRRALRYLDRTCAQRGRYVWQKGRFVRAR